MYSCPTTPQREEVAMKLALSGTTALAALRMLRTRRAKAIEKPARCDLPVPSHEPAKRWTRETVLAALGPYARSEVCVAVPEAKHRIRAKGVRCVVHARGIPKDSYIDLGDGLALPRPELLFVELGTVLSPDAHLLVGLELCGTYSLAGGFLLPQATTAEKIRAYLGELGRVDGMAQARAVAGRLLDNAWSPMEAGCTLLIRDRIPYLGYGLGDITLNERVGIDEGTARSRVPDIVFRGTKVGINYDGEGHLDLGGIVSATTASVLNPESSAAARALDKAMRGVREKYVDDNRRDRDLMSEGYVIFTITKEDLYEEGAFDSVMLQVMTAIERDPNGRSMRRQRRAVLNRRLARERQLRIWSLLPGKTGEEARARLEGQLGPQGRVADALLTRRGVVLRDERDVEDAADTL
ncbi:MAG: hypothetical protein E7Z98_08260 [Olsenella sp.]|nr:hypothetical protein [Olsenella sp.]